MSYIAMSERRFPPRPTVSLVNLMLIDLIDLSLVAKQAHWYIKAPALSCADDAMDKVKAKLEGHIQSLADRVVDLGEVALADVFDADQQSEDKENTLASYPIDIKTLRGHYSVLSDKFAMVAERLEEAANDAASYQDSRTAGLLNEISDDLKSHLNALASRMQTECLAS